MGIRSVDGGCNINGLVLKLTIVIALVSSFGEGQLSPNFYSSSCPNVENLVRQAVSTKYFQTFATAPATLRLFFHDCFVTGCDASVMVWSPSFDAEKDALENLSLAGDGFETINEAKQAVEAVCPGVVSCADIMALAARDVVVLAGGQTFSVELGRRDGLVSQKSLVNGSLPDPAGNLTQLIPLFAKHNLSQVDMIALSGAHTIGFSHCSRFHDRLYPVVDPALDPVYAQQLIAACPRINVDPNVVVQMDPTSPRFFDNAYFQNVAARKGMFTSDATLLTESTSNATVNDFANIPGDFFAAFATAMVKLGRTGVKTGNQGRIRTNCTDLNS